MEFNSNNVNFNAGSFDWDTEICDREVIIEEGDTEFTVTKLVKTKFTPDKNSPKWKDFKGEYINCADITCSVVDPDTGRTAYTTKRLFLNDSGVRQICAFFESIGLMKKGEKFRMAWDKVEGKSGHCHMKPSEYNGTRKNNISYFISKEEWDKKNNTNNDGFNWGN